MEDIKQGDKVKWIQPMCIVPHPDGNTDRHGKVLSVFRDKERTGVVMSTNRPDKTYHVRPDGIAVLPKGMPSYYDTNVAVELLVKL
jgi:hypothetical protein